MRMRTEEQEWPRLAMGRRWRPHQNGCGHVLLWIELLQNACELGVPVGHMRLFRDEGLDDVAQGTELQ